MKTKAITNNINGLQFNELCDFMKRLICESLYALSGLSNKEELVEMYETCTMDDYFTEWDQLWDEDEVDGFIGEGLDTISSKFVLNDETRADFEKAFSLARDAALQEYKEL